MGESQCEELGVWRGAGTRQGRSVVFGGKALGRERTCFEKAGMCFV